MSRMTLFGFSIALAAASILPVAAQQSAPIVVGYVFPQDNLLEIGQIDAHRLNRVNYAFANIKEGRMVPGFKKDAENLALLTDLRHKNPSLQILVSVGGWLWSTNFSDIALTPESRETFIRSAIEFVHRYDLDGLDIDWEYPGMPGAGHTFRSQDKQNFTLLLREIRKQFDHESSPTHRRLLLTIAAGASDEYLAHTEMAKLQQYVDTINLMAYDYYEPGSDRIAGNHAPLFTNHFDPKKVSADASIQAFERAGVSPGKILLGVPIYGHLWSGVANIDHGLFKSGKPSSTTYAPYSVIQSTMLQNGFTRYWDSIASVPYLYNPASRTFVSYEDPESLAAKSNYVLKHRLGGIMFWDYSGDPSGTLITVIHNALAGQLGKEASAR
jgi:chitinase